MSNINRYLSNESFSLTDSQTESLKERKIDIPVVDNTESREELIARIETVTSCIIQQLCSGRLPQMSYSSSHPYTLTGTQQIMEENDDESQFPEESNEINGESYQSDKKTVINFARKRSKDKFALMMTVMAAAHRLLITNTTITRRSLYYDLKNEKTSNLVPEQRQVDLAVNHVANLLNCAPWELNLLPTSKGLAAGELTLTLADKRIIDCTAPGGALIPHIASNVISIRTTAKMALVVEKDAVFQKLLEEDCTSLLNCILVTGKGYPDVATRMFVKLLSEKMALPVYAIVDADPFGVDIMCVYRFGSASLSKEKESLACPNVRWLGIHPSELVALGVSTVPLTEFDLSKLIAIKGRPYMNDAFLKELELMRTGKAEIEGLSSFSRRFLSATYLPCKIKGGDYI
ncbi:PREDICTED: meiotic recombination protein SPO11 [Dufourea novaeangliae]|uniref:DNA topoisomerase (ATP-hydrolyzing) n=1 Tax=Dufourea novaeangliae TaxID=178035 RepID=A0A154PMB7_DUFNO|nr:PREDICTED: meiotic recombination protein SPO11 [Dufourea novaeangliae]KZC12973.1 Meiotic recombination protein SPO11 [Dufourea novaeangliae]